jgi:hypothetical protein
MDNIRAISSSSSAAAAAAAQEQSPASLWERVASLVRIIAEYAQAIWKSCCFYANRIVGRDPFAAQAKELLEAYKKTSPFERDEIAEQNVPLLIENAPYSPAARGALADIAFHSIHICHPILTRRTDTYTVQRHEELMKFFLQDVQDIKKSNNTRIYSLYAWGILRQECDMRPAGYQDPSKEDFSAWENLDFEQTLCSKTLLTRAQQVAARPFEKNR